MMEQIVRSTDRPTQAGDWALVLAAAGIEHRVVEEGGLFVIVVAAPDLPAATTALAEFDAEGAPAPELPAPDLGPSRLGLLCGIGFAVLFLATGNREGASPWFAAGSASAELIMKGQWWRTITALTLHADVMHLVGNVLASLLFVSAVGRWLGTGLGAAAILGSAAVANFLTAAVHRTNHISVGASTATFAALGLVAGLQAVRRWRHATRRRYAWLPLGAGLGLYAMLGVGAGADIYAHLFGLGMGAVTGLVAAVAGVRGPRPVWQTVLGLGALALVALAWSVAFRAAVPS